MKRDQLSSPGKKYTATALIFIIALWFISTNIFPQERFSIEVRPGINFALKDMGDAKLGTGFGFEGTAAYSFIPHLAVYAGWGWNKFKSERSFAGSDVDFEETGYTFGLQFIRPFGKSKLKFLIRAGGIYDHIEAENSNGDIKYDSKHGLGWQFETGLAIPFAKKWQVLPSVRYRSLSREFNISGVNTPVDLNYFSLGIGLSRVF